VKRLERPDEHLLATVRGLQTALAAKDKDVQRLSRDLLEARAGSKKLRDKLQVDSGQLMTSIPMKLLRALKVG
jgi:hypothetical protein